MTSLSSQDSYKVVNQMFSTKLHQSLNMFVIHSMLPNSIYFRGRPTMIKLKLPGAHYTILIFPNGRIQLLGKTTSDDHEYVRTFLHEHLKLNIPPFKLDVMTVVCKILRSYNLHKLQKCTPERFYEPELFPALLLSKWKPIHVSLFGSGSVVLTGVKSFDDVYKIIKEIKEIYF